MLRFIQIITVFSVLFLLPGCQSASGVSGGKFSELPISPNAVSSRTDQTDKRVEPLSYIGTRQESMDKMLKAFKTYGTHDLVTMDDNYVHAVFITGFFKFRDDLELYFDDKAKLIHYRSASRLGYSDMGLNRNRSNELKKLYMEK